MGIKKAKGNAVELAKKAWSSAIGWTCLLAKRKACLPTSVTVLRGGSLHVFRRRIGMRFERILAMNETFLLYIFLIRLLSDCAVTSYNFTGSDTQHSSH